MGAVRRTAKVAVGSVRTVWWAILFLSIGYHVGRVFANPETRFYLAKAAEWLRGSVLGENWSVLDFLFDDGLTWVLSVLFGVALKSVYDSSKKRIQRGAERRRMRGTV